MESLRNRGDPSSVITSGNDLVKPYLTTEANHSHLFCAPEALALLKWRTALTNPAVFECIIAVVIDEAHCVSKW